MGCWVAGSLYTHYEKKKLCDEPLDWLGVAKRYDTIRYDTIRRAYTRCRDTYSNK